MIEAADESRDQAAAPSTNGDAAAGCATVPVRTATTRAIRRTRADAARRRRWPRCPSAGEVREFFSQLQVRREASGKVVIEAPAEAASTLGALFEGMAALLQSVAKPRIESVAVSGPCQIGSTRMQMREPGYSLRLEPAATGCGLRRGRHAGRIADVVRSAPVLFRRETLHRAHSTRPTARARRSDPPSFLGVPTMDRREFFKQTAAGRRRLVPARRRPGLRPLAPPPRPMKRSASPASASAARETATPTTPAGTARSSPCATSTAKSSTRWAKKYPKAKKYFDYRKMLEELGDKIDAVTVSTPDHTHAPASVMAMRMGKHCFCQKPLTWSIEEARLMRTLAAEKKLCTQMGNQGTAENGFRAGRRADPIGDARADQGDLRLDQSPDLAAGHRPAQGHAGYSQQRPLVRVPGRGPRPALPPDYQPFNWRGWLDFGTGALGDMACHTINIAAWRSSCSTPSRSRSSTPRVSWTTRATRSGRSSAPSSARATAAAPLTLTWFDGGDKLPEDKRTYKEHLHGEKAPGSGLLLVGEKGSFFSENDYGAEHTLLPKDKFKDVEKPKPTLPRSPGHFTEWVEAIKAGDPDQGDVELRLRRPAHRDRAPGRRRAQGRHRHRVGPRGHEGQERPLRRSVHPARLSQGLLDPHLSEFGKHPRAGYFSTHRGRSPA